MFLFILLVVCEMPIMELCRVPDTLPDGMGVCVVKYSDWSGKPYSHFGRAMFWHRAPIPPICESDSIYAGELGSSHGNPGEAWLYGYPGNYMVLFMFPWNFTDYWASDSPALVATGRALVDTLELTILEGCTTYVDAIMPWSPKELNLGVFGPWSVMSLDRYGKIRITVEDLSGEYPIVLAARDPSDYEVLSWSTEISNDNSMSLLQGYYTIEVIIPNRGSIVFDSVYIERDEVLELDIAIPDSYAGMTGDGIEQLINYPDEWLHTDWKSSSAVTLSPYDEEYKCQELLNFFIRPWKEPTQCWNLISVFRNGVLLQNQDDPTRWYPLDEHYVGGIRGVSTYGRVIGLNVVRRTDATPELAMIDQYEEVISIVPYSQMGFENMGYPSCGAIMLHGSFEILDDGRCIYIGRDYIRCFEANLEDVSWEVRDIPEHLSTLGRTVMFAQDYESFIITSRHTGADRPAMMFDSQGQMTELRSVSYGSRYVYPRYASADLDTFIFRASLSDAIVLVSDIESGHDHQQCQELISTVGMTSDYVSDNGNRIVLGDEDSIWVYSVCSDIDSSNEILSLPRSINRWYLVEPWVCIDSKIFITGARSDSHVRYIAFLEDTCSPIWMSPIRLGKDFYYGHQLEQTQTMESTGLFTWYDGLIHIMNFRNMRE